MLKEHKESWRKCPHSPHLQFWKLEGLDPNKLFSEALPQACEAHRKNSPFHPNTPPPPPFFLPPSSPYPPPFSLIAFAAARDDAKCFSRWKAVFNYSGISWPACIPSFRPGWTETEQQRGRKVSVHAIVNNTLSFSMRVWRLLRRHVAGGGGGGGGG